MIEYLCNNEKYITAFVEWILVNENLEVDDNGTHMAIVELFIHPELNGYQTLKHFVREILQKAPTAQTCTFVREYKYKGKQPRTYTRKQFERFAEV